MSVVVGVTEPDQIDQIGPIWAKTRRDIRNIINRKRRSNPAWKDVELTCWLEIDSVDYDQFQFCGYDKQQQILELSGMDDLTGRLWIVTFHGVVKNGLDLDVNDIRNAFEKHWSGYNQVDVRPFWPHQTVCQNLSGIINYCLKNECKFTDADRREIAWSTSQVRDLYVYIDGMSQGFKSIRLTMNASASRKRDEDEGQDLNEKQVIYNTVVQTTLMHVMSQEESVGGDHLAETVPSPSGFKNVFHLLSDKGDLAFVSGGHSANSTSLSLPIHPTPTSP